MARILRGRRASEPEEDPINLRSANDNFRKEKPPTFDGLGDPSDAERWVRSIERIFEYIRCPENKKVKCATYQLVDEADFWWEAVKHTISDEEWEEFTWEDFKNKLYEKYIPDCYQQKKVNEFWNLKQRKGSVTEYDRMFNQLSRHAPYLVSTDAERATKFRAGLRPEIAIALASVGPLTYAQTLSRALTVESILPTEREMGPTQVSSQGKRRREDHSENSNNNDNGKKPWRGNEPQQPSQYPSKGRNLCPQCQKPHSGECRQGMNACYKCGRSGHFAKNCPTQGNARGTWTPPANTFPQPLKQVQPRNPPLNQRPPQYPRAYAINQQKAARVPENLSGMIYLDNLHILTLFHKRAYHTFITKFSTLSLYLKLESVS